MPSNTRDITMTSRWLFVPHGLANAIGLLLWLSFVGAVVPKGARTVHLLVAVAGSIAATILIGALRYRAVFAAFIRYTRQTEGQPSPELAERVVPEMTRAPAQMFRTVLAQWTVTAALTAAVMYLFPPPGRSGLGAAALLGLLATLLAPAVALGSYLGTAARARRVLVVLGNKLGAAKVISLVPAQVSRIRTRLLMFIAIVVLVPTLTIHHVSTELAQSGVYQISTAAPVDRGTVLSRIQARDRAVLVGLGALAVLFAVAAAWSASRGIADPLRGIARDASQLGQGRIAEVRIHPAEGELWAVSSAFTSMQAHLSDLLGQLRRTGLRIGSTAEEIIASSRSFAEGATEQATSLNETSATTEELARSARQIAENAASVANLAQKTVAAAQEGQGFADEFFQAMGRMGEDTNSIAASVTKLQTRVQQIGKIVDLINGIADKSDLLALSAELEGTKAGEVGRGFSLVAGEIRRLAENVLESTREIAALIEEIREATRIAVGATEAGVSATLQSTETAREVREALNHILQLAASTSEAVKSISLATAQQQGGTDQLADAMFAILSVTQKGMGASKQMNAATEDLAALAQELRATVERFSEK